MYCFKRVLVFIPSLSLTLIFAQANVSGTVTDLDTGKPLVGANVVVEGT